MNDLALLVGGGGLQPQYDVTDLNQQVQQQRGQLDFRDAPKLVLRQRDAVLFDGVKKFRKLKNLFWSEIISLYEQFEMYKKIN